MATEYQKNVPIPERLHYYKNGFLAASGAIYDFENHHPDNYINDIARSKQTKINGTKVAFSRNKLAFHQLLNHNNNKTCRKFMGC